MIWTGHKQGLALPQQGELEMSKATNTSKTTPTLADLKLAVVNFHKGDENEYLRTQVARDACYTSNNSIQWKLQQMLDIKAELASLMEGEGAEVVDVNIAKKVEIYQKMELELDELQDRHNADLSVYNTITGEDWTSRPKSKMVKNSQGVLAAAKAILG
jgi:hypothetical protein